MLKNRLNYAPAKKILTAGLLSSGFMLAAGAVSAQDNAPQQASIDGYKVLTVMEAHYAGGQYIHSCTNEACDSVPVLDVQEDMVSALLQSTRDGSLVSCTYQRFSTRDEDKTLLNRTALQTYTGLSEGGLQLADDLRPAPAHTGNTLANNTLERGGCVPFETPVDVNDLRHADIYRNPRDGLGLNNEGISAGVGETSMIYDKVREDRLIDEFKRARQDGKNPFPVVMINHDPDWSYFSANGAACPNTGDFSVAEEIQRHYEDHTIMEHVPLRGPCPLVP